jgi:WD40 repeat protein
METWTWGAKCPTAPAKQLWSVSGAGSGAIRALAFSADRRVLAAVGADGKGHIWDIGHSKPRLWSQFTVAGGACRSLAFSTNRLLLAVGSEAGQVSLFNVAEKASQQIRVLRGGAGSVDALAFSPDGKWLAAGGSDQTLRVWEPGASAGGEARTVLSGHAKPIQALVFSPDGQCVATAGLDASVRVWSLNWVRATQKQCLSHRSGVATAAFSADGKMLATGVQDRGIWLWDVSGVKPTVIAELNDHSGGIRLVLTTPESDSLVSVGEDRKVINWDLRTRRPVSIWQLPEADASCLVLTPDGRYLSRGLADGSVEIFRIAEKRK